MITLGNVAFLKKSVDLLSLEGKALDMRQSCAPHSWFWCSQHKNMLHCSVCGAHRQGLNASGMVADMVQTCTWADGGIDMLEPVVAELDERIARTRLKLLDQLDRIEKMWDIGRGSETVEALELQARVEQFNAICGQPMIRSFALKASYASPALAADAESKT